MEDFVDRFRLEIAMISASVPTCQNDDLDGILPFIFNEFFLGSTVKLSFLVIPFGVDLCSRSKFLTFFNDG